MADFIANSAPASNKRKERKVQRSSWRNGNVSNVPASMSSSSTVLPLAVRPTSLAWEIIKKNLSILWWPLTLTSVHGKNFIRFMNEPRKHFQSFQKFLSGVIVLLPGTYPHQHQAHKCSLLSTHRPAFYGVSAVKNPQLLLLFALFHVALASSYQKPLQHVKI